MVTELDLWNVWIPELMTPGSVFPFEEPQPQEKEAGNPFVAILACPECGICGLITKNHSLGTIPVICDSPECSAEFFLVDEKIVARKPM